MPPRGWKKNMQNLIMKNDVIKEKEEGKVKLEERIKCAKENLKVIKIWYEKSKSGDVRKYTLKTNGNKYSKLLGNINTKSGKNLIKLLENNG